MTTLQIIGLAVGIVAALAIFVFPAQPVVVEKKSEQPVRISEPLRQLGRLDTPEPQRKDMSLGEMVRITRDNMVLQAQLDNIELKRKLKEARQHDA